MDIQLIRESDTSIGIKVENEDFSIMDILHQELLKNPKVVISGVVIPHPLLKQHIIKMKVNKRANPIKILISSSEQAVKKADVILKEAQRAIKEVYK